MRPHVSRELYIYVLESILNFFAKPVPPPGWSPPHGCTKVGSTFILAETRFRFCFVRTFSLLFSSHLFLQLIPLYARKTDRQISFCRKTETGRTFRTGVGCSVMPVPGHGIPALPTGFLHVDVITVGEGGRAATPIPPEGVSGLLK